MKKVLEGGVKEIKETQVAASEEKTAKAAAPAAAGYKKRPSKKAAQPALAAAEEAKTAGGAAGGSSDELKYEPALTVFVEAHGRLSVYFGESGEDIIIESCRRLCQPGSVTQCLGAKDEVASWAVALRLQHLS